uniref:PARG catalytic Macro domain-containing protein n=1 Tax=Arcella intermedia TaxID=1963864 RepID=A0A6B2L8A4_9EUKA
MLKVVNAPHIFASGLKLTKRGEASQIQLSKDEVLTLLSLSFFGLMEYKKTDFTELFKNTEFSRCLCHYYIWAFKQASCSSWYTKYLTIERRVLLEKIHWQKRKIQLNDLSIIDKHKGIEDFRDCIQVNFADPMPGGTLPSAVGDIVQEEILFLIYPELFVTCLLVPKLGDRESLAVHGLHRISNYEGYQTTFKWTGMFFDDSNEITIIFMDALIGGATDKKTLDRQLNKAFIAFSVTDSKPIATGNWGCGAFGGSFHQTAIIQLMAAAQAGVTLKYTTFSSKYMQGFELFYLSMIKNKITVKEMYTALVSLLLTKSVISFSSVEEFILKDRFYKELGSL